MRFPKSLLFFVATGIVYLLQVFPMPGIILMMMLAAFWSVLLINAGMIGIAVEAASGSVGRIWLLVPLLWFGGYEAAALSDHLALWRLRGEIARSNVGVRVPFDPTAQALVFANVEGGAWLIENSALPVAYQRNANYSSSPHVATHMIARAVCDKIRAEPGLSGAGIYTFGFHDDSETIGRARFETRFCELRQPENPTLPVVLVESVERKHNAGSVPVVETVTTITTPDGRRYVVRGGIAAPLSWIPMPVLGCALDSGMPAWRCFHQFKRDAFTPLTLAGPRYRRDSTALMQALGLTRIVPGDRRGADPSSVLHSVAITRDRIVKEETAMLDALIAGKLQRAPGSLRSLYGRMDVLLPRLDRMVAAVDDGVAAGELHGDRVQQLSHLLRQVPEEPLNAARRAVRSRHRSTSALPQTAPLNK